MMSIFSKIVSGEIKANVVAENADYMAFLDVNPLVMGHVLVIPKKEIDYIFDLEDDLYIGLTLFAKQVAKAVKIAFPCKKIGLTVIGLEVAHAHLHLIPINNVSDMNFTKEKLKPRPEELAEAAVKIKAAFR